MKLSWWKILAMVCVFYALVAGMLIPVPRLDILNETIRNLFYHVTMWFTMIILMMVSLYNSIAYLKNSNLRNDLIASESAKTGMVFGAAGLLTGMVWAKFTWGAFWVNDAKLNGAAATMLAYSAYFILRNAIDDEQKRARLASVYAIFAFTLMIVFIMILPRLTDSLHPGNGGNPAFSKYDLDNTMRFVFYPAIIGWSLLGVWIMNIKVRLKMLSKN
jgi:heme exporter protein C